MSDKTIPTDVIKKLIDEYWGYEGECMSGEYDKVAASRAGLYRTVINDLEQLLPRETLADVPEESREEYVGMWAEGPGFKQTGKLDVIAAVNCYDTKSVFVLHPNVKAADSLFAPSSIIPRNDIPRAWFPNGDPGEGMK